MLLPLFPEFWDYRCVLSTFVCWLIVLLLAIKPRALCMVELYEICVDDKHWKEVS